MGMAAVGVTGGRRGDGGDSTGGGAGSLGMEGAAGGPGAGGFGAGRLPGVDLGQGMMPQFDRMSGMGDGRDSSPGPFHGIGAEVSATGGPPRGGGMQPSGPDAEGGGGRPLSPLMNALGESGDTPPGLARLHNSGTGGGGGGSLSALGGGAPTGLGSALQHDMPPSPPPHDPNERASFDALSGTPVGDGQGGGAPSNGTATVSAIQEGGMDARGSGSIDGRHGQAGGGGGGGFAPTSNGGGGGGGGGEFSKTSAKPQDSDGGGQGGGGDGPSADGEVDGRKRLRIEEMLHSAGGNDS